jgi:hypothetical protein
MSSPDHHNPDRLRAILNAHFAFLFAREPRELSYQYDVNSATGAMALAYGDVELRVSLRQDDLSFAVGPLGSNVPAEWKSIGLVKNYLTRPPVDYAASLAEGRATQTQSIEQNWDVIAAEIAPHFDAIVAFAEPRGFADRLSDYNAYVKERRAEMARQMQAHDNLKPR